MEHKHYQYFACILYIGMLGTTTYALATSQATLGVSHKAIFKGMKQRYIPETPTQNKQGVAIRYAYTKDRTAGIGTAGNKENIKEASFAAQLKDDAIQRHDTEQFLKNLFPNAAPVYMWMKGAVAISALRDLNSLFDSFKTGKYDTSPRVSHVIVQGRKVELWTDLTNPDDQVILITVTPEKAKD